MTFKEYEEACKQFDMSPDQPWYYVLGLCGESGEVMEKDPRTGWLGALVGKVAERMKKHFRIPPFKTLMDATGMAKELGDVLWYLTRLANYYGFTLEQIAQMNIDKLTSRKERGVLKGSGDNR